MSSLIQFVQGLVKKKKRMGKIQRWAKTRMLKSSWECLLNFAHAVYKKKQKTQILDSRAYTLTKQ